MDLRINRRIRAPKIRVIDQEGNQAGIMSVEEALSLAQRSGLDLVEISPSAEPPVCKIIDYGKYRYDQTKKEKENKKAQHQIKIKEIKLKPNIDEHDFETKLKAARQFLEKGNKVKISCFFRGREMTYPERGEKVVKRMCDELEDLGQLESPLKRMGRSIICVIAPGSGSQKKKEGKVNAKDEDK